MPVETEISAIEQAKDQNGCALGGEDRVAHESSGVNDGVYYIHFGPWSLRSFF